jgi:hypothetical protein
MILVKRGTGQHQTVNLAASISIIANPDKPAPRSPDIGKHRACQ